MEDPVSLSDTEDYSIETNSLLHTSRDHQDYLIMTIELGDGQQEHIKIHSSDDPTQLAHNFILSHQLSPDLEQSLATLIKQNIGLLDKRSQPSPLFKSSLSNYNSLTKEPQQFRSFEGPGHSQHTPQINKRSMMITSKQSRGDIHERLYKLAARKKVKVPVEKDTQSTNEKSVPSFYNPGEILYIKGMAMQHSRRRFTEELSKEKDLLTSKELTFKPSINPGQNRYDERPEDILLKKAKDYEAHKQVLKERFIREETKECSFQPNPCKDYSRGSERKVHDDLYKESFTRLEKMNELSTKKLFPFEPNSDKPKSLRYESQEEFIDRLLNSKQKLYEEMEKLRSLQNFKNDHDKSTGQELYSPVTNQNFEVSQRKREKTIWQYLYDMKDTKKDNIKKLLKEEEKVWKNSTKLKIGSQSQKVFEKFRKKQYKKLFLLMDSDQDGKISANSIDLNGIEQKKLEVLSPLLEHLLNSGDDIDFETFASHLEQLRNHLDLTNKDIILKRDKKVEIPEIDPHPQLSPNTIEIYERIRPDEGLYDRGVKEKIVNQLRNEKKKQIKDDESVKECSFKPVLVNGGRIGYMSEYLTS